MMRKVLRYLFYHVSVSHHNVIFLVLMDFLLLIQKVLRSQEAHVAHECPSDPGHPEEEDFI